MWYFRSKNDRRQIIHVFTVLILSVSSALSYAIDNTSSILVLGDSLSAAYGIDRNQGWVSLLDKKLNAQKHQYRIVNASISGETTVGGLNRLPQLPDSVIIELGANDGLRGFPISKIRDNLTQLIQLSQGIDAKVLLAGMHLPPNYGKRYTRMFHESFQLIAEQHNIELIPFLLEGVADNAALMQRDGLHPTAAAQPQILSNVFPYLEKILLFGN